MSGLLVSRVTNIKGIIDNIQGFIPNYNQFLTYSDFKSETTVYKPNVIVESDTLLLELDVLSAGNDNLLLLNRFYKNAVRVLNDTMFHRDIRTWCALLFVEKADWFILHL